MIYTAPKSGDGENREASTVGSLGGGTAEKQIESSEPWSLYSLVVTFEITYY